jgi:hypothetical protein
MAAKVTSAEMATTSVKSSTTSKPMGGSGWRDCLHAGQHQAGQRDSYYFHTTTPTVNS